MTAVAGTIGTVPLRERPYKLFSPAEAAELGSDLNPVIPDLWEPSLTVVTGQPFAGKSILTLMMADALISGSQFLGRSPQPGKHLVAYAALERTA